MKGWIALALKAMDWLLGRDRKAALNARVAEVRANAQRDAAQADAQAAKAEDPMAVLREQFNRNGPHIGACALILIAGLAVALTACAPPVQPPGQVKIVDTFCDRAHEIRIADGDQLTKETARAILAFDLQVRQVCGDK